MTTRKILLFGLALPLLIIPSTAMAQLQDMDWLDWGYSAEVRGDYERALEIWSEGRRRMEQPNSRLGMAFIRLVTEQRLVDWYEEATEMYLWAIAHPYTGNNRGVIRRELERLAPITGEALHRQWLTWLEANDDRLPADMRGFWIQTDPTPGELLNERLIEHWLRIAEARRQFTRNRLTHYQTDDRGLIYVRYGEPDRRVRGRLTLDGQHTVRWFEQQAAATVAKPQHPVQQPGSERKLHWGSEWAEPIAATEERTDLSSRIGSYIAPYHRAPEFEVWVYDAALAHEEGRWLTVEGGVGDGTGGEQLADGDDTGAVSIGIGVAGDERMNRSEQPMIFLFGTDIHTGGFRRMERVGEFIPLQAFQSDRHRELDLDLVRQGVSPALLLQMIYYEQLSAVHPWFGEQLQALRSMFLEQGDDIYKAPDLSRQTRSGEVLSAWAGSAPQQISTEEQLLPQIPLQIHQYRLLNEASEPVIVTFLESRPGSALRQELERLTAADRPSVPVGRSADATGGQLTDGSAGPEGGVSLSGNSAGQSIPYRHREGPLQRRGAVESQPSDYTLRHDFLAYNREWEERSHEVHRPRLDEALYRTEEGPQPDQGPGTERGGRVEHGGGAERGGGTESSGGTEPDGSESGGGAEQQPGSRAEQRPKHQLGDSGQSSVWSGKSQRVVQSVFITPHTGRNFQVGSARLLTTRPETPGYSDLFANDLRGLGSVRNRQPEPLGNEPGVLELADLILGYRDDLPDDYPFSFRVANDQTFAADESLILHFEVYNLEPQAGSGFTRFELTYRISPVLEDGSLQTDDEAFYLTIRFEDDRTRLIEDLEIQTASLSSGLYELRVTIEDLVSRQQKSRSIRFEVTE